MTQHTVRVYTMRNNTIYMWKQCWLDVTWLDLGSREIRYVKQAETRQANHEMRNKWKGNRIDIHETRIDTQPANYRTNLLNRIEPALIERRRTNVRCTGMGWNGPDRNGPLFIGVDRTRLTDESIIERKDNEISDSIRQESYPIEFNPI